MARLSSRFAGPNPSETGSASPPQSTLFCPLMAMLTCELPPPVASAAGFPPGEELARRRRIHACHNHHTLDK
jgi:hypothetical protein